eukprot:RCo051763
MAVVYRCLDNVPVISLREAVQKLDGVQFTHPDGGEMTFDFSTAWGTGKNCLEECLRWAQHSAPEDVRHAGSLDCLAALRSFTAGELLCPVLNYLMANRGNARFPDVVFFAKLVLTALRSLPERFRISGVKGYRAEGGVDGAIKIGVRTIYFNSLTSFTTDPKVLANFMTGKTGERTLYTVSEIQGYNIAELSCYAEEREILVEFGTAVDVRDVDYNEVAIGAEEVKPGLVSVKGRYNQKASVDYLRLCPTSWCNPRLCGPPNHCSLKDIVDSAGIPCDDGAYLLNDPLGHGGFGNVYLAVNTATCNQVVIKDARCAGGASAVQLREARILKSLEKHNHPNVVKLLDILDYQERLLIVMERMDQ